MADRDNTTHTDDHPDNETDLRSDEDLLLSIATGDPTAVAELYTRHHTKMRRAAAYALGSRGQVEEVEDAVQDAIVKIIESKAAQYQPVERASVGTWLYALARWSAIQLNQPRNHHHGYPPATVELGAALIHNPDQFATEDPWAVEAEQERGDAQREAELAIATELVAGLSPKQRAIAELVWLHGKTRTEAAAILGLTDAGAKKRIRLARAALARVAEQEPTPPGW